MPHLRLKAIICEVLAREIYHCAARSHNVVDVELLEKGLHSVPADLREALQKCVDRVPADRYDAIILGYGLCGTALAGLRARDLPLVLPRAHDCITLYLGSQQAYQALFTDHPGTYYYTPDYIERGGADSIAGLGANDDATKLQAQYQEYVEKYGAENADYLMEVMGAWKAHYDQATYIDIEGLALPDYRPRVREQSAKRGWSYNEVLGQLTLLRDLVDGKWEEGRFLRVGPGQVIVGTYDSDVMRAGAGDAFEEINQPDASSG